MRTSKDSRLPGFPKPGIYHCEISENDRENQEPLRVNSSGAKLGHLVEVSKIPFQ